MANTKISQLPSYTGTAADLRWFVMNNSGETETYKYSGYSSGVRPGSMNNTSFVSIYYPVNSVSSIYSGILGGEANSITSTDGNGRNTIIGGYGNSITYTHTSTVIGGYSNTGNGYFGGVILGRYNTCGGGVNSCIFGGESNITGNGGGIFGAYVSKTSCANESAVNLFGTYGARISTNGGTGVGIFGGNINYYHAGSSIASAFSQSAGGIFGGWNNLIGDSRADTGTGSAIVPIILGGSGNTIYSTVSTYQNEAVSILGGVNNGISGATNSTILQGSGSTVTSGSTHVVMLGTKNRTNTRSDATFVENLVVFNYAALDFNNDASAAAGGVVLGQVYHNNGSLRIRIS
jgi:hypothetical protein